MDMLTYFSAITGLATLIALFGSRFRTKPAEVLDQLMKLAFPPVRIGPTIRPAHDDYKIPWSKHDGLGPQGSTAEHHTGGDAYQHLLHSLRPAIVIGAEGSGKSTIARRISEELKQVRRKPVIRVSLVSWRNSDRLLDWAAREVVNVSVRQGHGKHPVRIVRGLIETGNIDLIFDGLDEIWEDAARQAFLSELAQTPLAHWLLLSRPFETSLPDQNVLIHDVIRLEPLAVTDSVAMLEQHGEAWEQVANFVESHPESEFSVLVRTPLFFELSRARAISGLAPPGSMVFPESGIPSRPEVAEQLFGWLVDAAVYAPGNGSPENRRRWLRQIARITRRGRREDFAWWDLSQAGSWIFSAAVGGLGCYAILNLIERAISARYSSSSLAGALGPWRESGADSAFGVIAALSLAATTGLNAESSNKVVRWTRSSPVRVGVMAGAWVGAGLGGEGGFWYSLLRTFLVVCMAVIVAVVIGSMFRSADGWLAKRGVTQGATGRAVPRQFGLSFSLSRVYIALGFGCFFPSMYLLGASDVKGETEPIFHRGFGASIVVGLTVAALVLLVLVVGVPTSRVSERRTLVLNAFFGAAFALIVSCICVTWMVALLWLIQAPPSDPASPPPADFADWFENAEQADQVLAISFILGEAAIFILGVCLVGLLVSSAGRFCLSLGYLVLARRLPLNIFAFLTWAHERGILRRSGLVHHFSHLAVRESLE